MAIYYIKKGVTDTNYWNLVAIENDESLAIETMYKIRKENPNSRYRVVKYIDTCHTSMINLDKGQ